MVFAYGIGEPPGVGPLGQTFVDTLRSRVDTDSVEVYAVDYPASREWSTGVDAVRGDDAHVVSMAHDCLKTKMVLGGHSQGAAVMGFPHLRCSGRHRSGDGAPTVAPNVARHVSSIVLEPPWTNQRKAIQPCVFRVTEQLTGSAPVEAVRF